MDVGEQSSVSEAGLSALLSSLSAEADDLILRNSSVDAENASLRSENEILRMQRNNLRERVTELQAAVSKHQATEAELCQSIRRISDTLSSALVEPNFADKTITFGPSTGRATVFEIGASRKSGSRRRSSSNPKSFIPGLPPGTASVPGSPLANTTFGTKGPSTTPTTPFGTPFGAACKFGDSPVVNDPFKTEGVQSVSTSAPGGSIFKKEPESSEPTKKGNLFSPSFDDPSANTSTQAGSAAKFGDSPVVNDPFKSAGVSTSAPEAGFFKKAREASASESSEPTKKDSLFSPSFDEPRAKSSTQTAPDGIDRQTAIGTANSQFRSPVSSNSFAEPAPVAETKESDKLVPCRCKSQDHSSLFPLPTPLSKRTFGVQPASSLPPPRSASFSYRATNVYEGDRDMKIGSISQMSSFCSYSVEEIRLWDYVNGDKGPPGISPFAAKS